MEQQSVLVPPEGCHRNCVFFIRLCLRTSHELQLMWLPIDCRGFSSGNSSFCCAISAGFWIVRWNVMHDVVKGLFLVTWRREADTAAYKTVWDIRANRLFSHKTVAREGSRTFLENEFLMKCVSPIRLVQLYWLSVHILNLYLFSWTFKNGDACVHAFAQSFPMLWTAGTWTCFLVWKAGPCNMFQNVFCNYLIFTNI